MLAKMILVLQPEPEETSVAYYCQDGRPVTVIARLWRAEDVPRCRLCEHCQLDGHPGSRLCTVVVDRYVPEGRAEMFAEPEEPEPGHSWKPIGPLDHPWWKLDAGEASPPPAADRRDAQSLAWEAFVRRA